MISFFITVLCNRILLFLYVFVKCAILIMAKASKIQEERFFYGTRKVRLR